MTALREAYEELVALYRRKDQRMSTETILKKISAELRVILLQAAEESGDRFARLPNEGSPPGHVDWNIVREQANRA